MKTKDNPIHSLIQDLQKGARPPLKTFIETLGKHFPLLYELEHTQQDPEWHAEGNVAIHTQRVLNEIYQILEHSLFTEQEQLILILSAVFHDIAKPISTKTRIIRGKERITSPRHADKGRSYLAYKLPDLGLSPETTRSIMAIVGHHHDPKQLIMKNQPNSQYKRLARLAPLHLLYWLELADMRGRTSSDLEEQIEIIEMFKLIVQEGKLWQQNNPYANWKVFLQQELNNYPEATQNLILANAIRNYEQEIIYTAHEALARSYEYRDAYSNLIITCGPSGSGKSTWIQKNYPNYQVISLDQLRESLTGKQQDQSKNGLVMQTAKEQLKDVLRKHQNVIWDATSLIKTQRQQITQLGFNYQANVSLAVFHKAQSIIIKQNQERSNPIPQQILEKQLKNTDFPYKDEAHQTTYIDT